MAREWHVRDSRRRRSGGAETAAWRARSGVGARRHVPGGGRVVTQARWRRARRGAGVVARQPRGAAVTWRGSHVAPTVNGRTERHGCGGEGALVLRRALSVTKPVWHFNQLRCFSPLLSVKYSFFLVNV